MRETNGATEEGGMYNELFRMTLDTTEIIKIENGWRHSYTFCIVEDTLAPMLTRNLVLDFTGYENTYYAYIFTYKLTEEEEETQWYEGKINDPSIISRIESYSPNYETQSMGGKDCYEVHYFPGTECSCGGDHPFGDSDCKCKGTERATPATLIFVLVPCPDNGGLGIDPWSSGGGGGCGSPGDGGGTITYPDPDPEDPKDNDPLEDIDDSFEGLGTAPVLDPPEEPEEDCNTSKEDLIDMFPGRIVLICKYWQM